MIQCTLKNESIACPFPQVCYEVRNASQFLVSSTCDCISNYGYTGPLCDIRTLPTNLYLGFIYILFLSGALFWLFACHRLLPRILLAFRTQTVSILIMSNLISLLGLFLHVVFLCLDAVDATVSSASQRRGDGLRVTLLWEPSFYLVFIILFFFVLNLVFVSAAWFQIAHQVQFPSSYSLRNRRMVRNWSLAVSIITLALSLGLFFSGLQLQLYLYWGLVAVFCLLSWWYGAFVITRTLKSITMDQELIVELHRIRKTALFTSVAVLLTVVGCLLQTTRTGESGHEMEPLGSAPKWVFGVSLAFVGISLTFAFLLLFGIGRRELRTTSVELSSKEQRMLAQ